LAPLSAGSRALDSTLPEDALLRRQHPMIARISRIILFVADVPKVAAFYQLHFGLEPMGPLEDGWLELRAEGCNLALHRGSRPAGSGSHSPAKIVFAVSDVREALADFAKTGLKFGQVFEWNGFAFADTKDPEGNPIQISSRGEDRVSTPTA
jgi:catechol 2,3-dioxygenase-like lactoylglutathione lyase family enzyme